MAEYAVLRGELAEKMGKAGHWFRIDTMSTDPMPKGLPGVQATFIPTDSYEYNESGDKAIVYKAESAPSDGQAV